MTTEAKGRQLICSDEAGVAKRQHTTPCSDCPWARTALNGWLGGASAAEWLADAHSEATIECHVATGAQCAGVAIYRRNVCKLPRPPNLVLPADRERCFATPEEFTDHHAARPGAKTP